MLCEVCVFRWTKHFVDEICFIYGKSVWNVFIITHHVQIDVVNGFFEVFFFNIDIEIFLK